jgi:5-methylcytosine-specific restriction endonuclease McrA
VTDRLGGRPAQRRNRAILAASDICHLCGHPGSDAVDHIEPLALGGADERRNLAPAHHTNPCETCGIKCNRVKSDKRIAPVIRRSGSLDR